MSEAKQSQLLLVTTSFAKLEEAKLMAQALVEQHLAVCVQIQEGVHSVYRWEGKLCEEREVLLVAKTVSSQWHAIQQFIKNNHPYDLPEIIGMTPAEYDQAYGQWIQLEVSSSS